MTAGPRRELDAHMVSAVRRDDPDEVAGRFTATVLRSLAKRTVA